MSTNHPKQLILLPIDVIPQHLFSLFFRFCDPFQSTLLRDTGERVKRSITGNMSQISVK